ncbi:MAG: hypothetical protein Q6364_06290, partial [Candidatus Hermodarchaeota archaeon]|nr:hypothetical protein [Candidatus Hermodarchaeota archaeon]
LLRPGRFDRIIFVPPPDTEARHEILQVHSRNMPLGKDVDLEELAKITEGYSGADLANLVREAGMYAIRSEEALSTVNLKHFEAALEKIKPSVTPEMLKAYEDYIAVMSTKRDAIDSTPGPYA